MSIAKRILQIAENEGIAISKLETIIGASKGVLSKPAKTDTDIQSKWISKIVENFPKYNTRWLLTGKGEMINTSEDQSSEIIYWKMKYYECLEKYTALLETK